MKVMGRHLSRWHAGFRILSLYNEVRSGNRECTSHGGYSFRGGSGTPKLLRPKSTEGNTMAPNFVSM